MRIHEIYSALSGEGVHVGIPVTIVRTQGCNLSCSYCDSAYAQDPGGGVEMSVESIVSKSRWPRWALITGGEPLLQKDLLDLVTLLSQRGVKVEIETNGSFEPPTWWAHATCWSVDAKCPSSGMHATFCHSWLGAREQDQVKFVVADEADLEYARKTFMYSGRVPPAVLISPVWPWTNEWLRRCVEFCIRYDTRLSLQQHKEIYGDEKGH